MSETFRLGDVEIAVPEYADLWYELRGYIEEATYRPGLHDAQSILDFMDELRMRRTRPIIDWMKSVVSTENPELPELEES
jgi:hypothetical protein